MATIAREELHMHTHTSCRQYACELHTPATPGDGGELLACHLEGVSEKPQPSSCSSIAAAGSNTGDDGGHDHRILRRSRGGHRAGGSP